MKGILKNEEPEDFKDFKNLVIGDIAPTDFDWDQAFNSPLNKVLLRNWAGRFFDKPKLREYLLKEQGYLCCYCCRRISNSSQMVIEHFKPKSKFKEETFKWENLFLSCSGISVKDKEGQVFKHCDESKDDHTDEKSKHLISPTDRFIDLFVCELVFSYSSDGAVIPQSLLDSEGNLLVFEQDVSFTIEILNLNAETLRVARANAISFLMDNNELIELSEQEVKILSANFSSKNEDGMFPENCAAILYILKHNF